MRLPELPIEFYDASVLRKIGSVISPVLHIDSYTASETRAGYARLCVQIDLEKPLISSIRMGKLVQKVLYEGIPSLCFCCSKLSHKQESYGLKVKEPNRDDEAGVSLKTNEVRGGVQSDLNYGPWMVVTRKKKNLGRLGKTSGPAKTFAPTPFVFKGNLDLSQASEHVKASEDPTKSSHSDSADSRCETACVVAGLNMQSDLEMWKDCVMEECLGNPSASSQQDPRHISRNKRKALAKNKGKGSKVLGIRNSKSSKSHKWLLNSVEGHSGLLLLSRELGSENQVENGEIFDRANTTAKIRVGNLVQEPSDGYSRGVHSSDKSGIDGNTVVV